MKFTVRGKMYGAIPAELTWEDGRLSGTPFAVARARAAKADQQDAAAALWVIASALVFEEVSAVDGDVPDAARAAVDRVVAKSAAARAQKVRGV